MIWGSNKQSKWEGSKFSMTNKKRTKKKMKTRKKKNSNNQITQRERKPNMIKTKW